MTTIPISEDQFKDWLIDLAKLFKWLVHHDRPARTEKGWRTPIQGDPGFPDLVLARRGRIIFAELKSEKGTLDPDQKIWLEHLDPSDEYEIYVWRPSDRREIEETLR